MVSSLTSAALMMPSCMIVATVGVVTAGDAATKPISASAATVPAAAVAMYAYRWRRSALEVARPNSMSAVASAAEKSEYPSSIWCDRLAG